MMALMPLVWGSPPRVRGKVKRRRVFLYHDGITPARAGKSRLIKMLIIAHWDHPRACGEKNVVVVLRCSSTGSPPRVRGKVYCSSTDLF